MNKQKIIFLEYKGKKYGAFKTCPIWLKEAFRRAVNYKCQDCNKPEEEVGTLEIHRKKRGIDGGLYVCVNLNHYLNNVKVLCSNCHKNYNYSKRLNYDY